MLDPILSLLGETTRRLLVLNLANMGRGLDFLGLD